MNRMTGAALAALILTGGLAMAETATFNRTGWTAVAGKADEADARHDMVAAAIAEIPAGTAQADVLARLGEPDQRFDNAWAYMVGTTIFGGEYRALLVSFDDKARVTVAKEVSSETWQ